MIIECPKLIVFEIITNFMFIAGIIYRIEIILYLMILFAKVTKLNSVQTSLTVLMKGCYVRAEFDRPI